MHACMACSKPSVLSVSSKYRNLFSLISANLMLSINTTSSSLEIMSRAGKGSMIQTDHMI